MIPHRSRAFLLAFCTLTFLARALPASADCDPIEGLAPLLAPGRVLLLGELHGTVESPTFTRDVACHAAEAGLDVVVGLELLTQAGGFETFLKSAGKPADRAALLSAKQWQRNYQDGRTSQAMAELIEGLARLRRAGDRVRVLPFDAQPPGGGQARERAMASNLAASVEASPEAMHIVLTGNLHSRITRGGRLGSEYEPMGYLLAQAIGAKRLTSLDAARAAGTAWLCAPKCGVIRLGDHGPKRLWSIDIDDKTRPSGHGGWYGVGTITASPPAVGEHDVSAAPTPPAAPAPPATPRKSADNFPPQTDEVLRPFQGSWQAYQYGSKAWTLDVDKQHFRGVLGDDDWYEGQIRLRPGSDPAEIDFVIEDCRCNYRGMSSRGIYRLEAESITLAAPRPGTSRPQRFNPNDGQLVELKRVEADRPE